MDNQKTQTPAKSKGRRVGKDDIEKARKKLDQFKAAKQGLNATIRFNERWYRQRHMEYLKGGELTSETGADGYNGQRNKQGERVEPVSAWLFNSIQNFHADYMDNFPRANVLPREERDALEAEKITRILPSLLDRIQFENVYSRAGWTKGIQGWTVYSLTWDKEANGGRGEISIRRPKLLNLYWDMEVDELDASSDVFYLHERDRDELLRDYPKIEKELMASNDETEKHEGPASGSKVTVVDWYYKKRNKSGRRVLHLCQFVGNSILYASENEKGTAERGLYDHGRYPFVVDVLYPMEDALYGFGKVAVGSSKQGYIDILSKSIMENALWSASPRYFAKRGYGFNLDDFLDTRKKVVEVDGNPSDHLMRVEVGHIDGNVLNLKDSLVEELRETTNMRDVATGSTTGGVTAASGIAALQEAAGKMSRDSNRTSFRAYREIVALVIELIRQFYTDAHFFRVLNEEDGEQVYIGIDNSGMRRDDGDVLFDLEITTERNSSYTRMAQNELMLSFFNAGFFDPQRADQALACLKMMDFEGKEELIRMVGENYRVEELMNALLEQMMVMAQSYDQLSAAVGVQSNETANAQALAQQVMGATAGGGRAAAAVPDLSGESSITKNARVEAASAASPV